MGKTTDTATDDAPETLILDGKEMDADEAFDRVMGDVCHSHSKSPSLRLKIFCVSTSPCARY